LTAGGFTTGTGVVDTATTGIGSDGGARAVTAAPVRSTADTHGSPARRPDGTLGLASDTGVPQLAQPDSDSGSEPSFKLPPLAPSAASGEAQLPPLSAASGEHFVFLPSTGNQARGIAEFAVAFVNGLGDPSDQVLNQVNLFHTDSVVCAVSALGLGTRSPSVLRQEALMYPVCTDKASEPACTVKVGQGSAHGRLST
jgi:hypothetical protein